MKRALILCAFAFAASFAAVSPARAQGIDSASMAKNSSSILLRWVDARGNLYPGGRVDKMQWTWSKIADNDAIESPALRLWVSSRLPADWKPRRVTSDGVTIVEPYKDGDTQKIVFDLRSSAGTLRFEFIDKQNRVFEMTMVINVSVTRPYILVRPECNKNDLRFMVHKIAAKHLFVGLSCVDRGDSFDIFFFRSKDSGWNESPGLVQFDPQNRYTAFKYHVGKPKEQVVYSQRLFKVGTLDEAKRQTEYSVFYNPKIKPNPFYINAGLGVTYYSYSEITEQTKSTQISLTGKTSFGYRIIPKVLDLAFNFFGNIVTATHSTTNSANAQLPDARFYGLNGRLGYRLPLGIGATEFMFLTGWYVWGMNVSNEVYGIKNLGGPQLFITMLNSQAGHAGWWMYGKFAMISDKLKITNLSNRELALGLGFELSARESKPFSITVDIAHAQFDNEKPGDQHNGMKLLSITTGVQKSL